MGRFFNRDENAVARIYIPEDSGPTLWVDDISITPTSVRVDSDRDGQYSTTLATTDYELLPLNADKGPEPRPYNRIRLTPWGDYSEFTEGIRVEVTARYGWLSVPDAIQRAAIQLTGILRLETPRATRRIAELGDIMEASGDAMSIVRQLAEQYKVWRV